jgi:hypothetical protein
LFQRDDTIVIIVAKLFGGEANEFRASPEEGRTTTATQRTTEEKQREEDDCHLFLFFLFFFFFFFRNGRQCDETVRLLSPFLADENNLVRKFRHILGGRESLSVRVGG